MFFPVRLGFICMSKLVCVHWPHHGTDAASTHSGLELAVHLFDSTSGVEALSQQDDAIQEEETGDSINDVLQNLNPV